jgi:Ras-related protein Rab-8A
MLVYDITDLESFQNLNSWLIENEKNASKNVYKILVGNKCDMENERKVTVEQGKDFAAQYGMKFFETSAKESTNVSDSFIAMTREIIKSASNKKTTVAPKTNNVVVAPSGTNIKNKKGCC